MDTTTYTENVIRRELDSPLPSCLGPGCCQECGRPREECSCREDILAELPREEHHIWPWNARMMYCPVDGQYHSFGCGCAHENPEVIPASVRLWYQENWVPWWKRHI